MPIIINNRSYDIVYGTKPVEKLGNGVTYSMYGENPPLVGVDRCLFTINPTPSNAKVIINGEETNRIILDEGSVINWSVSADGYIEENGSLILNENKTISISLEVYVKSDPVRFDYTGDFQTYIVPNGCKKLEVDVVGCRGGGYNNKTGGKGGRVQATLSVTPGQKLYVYCGTYPTSTKGVDVYPVYNASDIRTNNSGVTDETSLRSRLVVAGGGGYAGYHSTGNGGAGGGLTGGAGTMNTYWSGQGGTQTAGGAAAAPNDSALYKNAEAGKFGLGGKGASFTHSSAGFVITSCGGAGWYGGGGGTTNYYANTGDGGGGSSYTHPDLCTEVVHTQGYSAATGNGWVIIKPL